MIKDISNNSPDVEAMAERFDMELVSNTCSRHGTLEVNHRVYQTRCGNLQLKESYARFGLPSVYLEGAEGYVSGVLKTSKAEGLMRDLQKVTQARNASRLEILAQKGIAVGVKVTSRALDIENATVTKITKGGKIQVDQRPGHSLNPNTIKVV